MHSKKGNDWKDWVIFNKKDASMGKHRFVRKLKEVLLNSKLTIEQRVLTSYSVLKDSEDAEIIDTAGMSKLWIATHIAIFHENNQKEIIEHALKTNRINARANDNKHSFI